MLDYNKIINNALRVMKDTNADFIKLEDENNFIRVNLEDGSILIEIHNEETEEICNVCYE